MTSAATANGQANGPGLREVDAAVRSALADLLGRSTNGRPPGHPRPSERSAFAGRLLSLREAEALSPEGGEVRVAPGTVVTPLARDYLKRLGISIRLVARDEVERARTAGAWAFAIESDRHLGLTSALRRALLGDPAAWLELGPTLDDAAGWLLDAPGRGALLLTEEASVAVYRACQWPGVRAAAACEPEGVARAVRALGANLLVVEPAGKSVAWLRQIGQTFRRAGGPVAPEWAQGGGAS